MKSVCFVFLVAFSMENFCASAQQYTVSACKDGTLMLNCLTGLIQIDDVFLADSSCVGRSCCPRQRDCRGSPSATYRNQVLTSCNGQQSCSMNVEIRNIGCGLLDPRNDYTNITYSCIAIQTSPEPTTLTTPFSFDEKKATEIEKEEGDMTSSQSSVDGSTTLNPTLPQKPGEATSESEQGKTASHVQTDQKDKDNGNLDRVTTLVAVIVGGVVITATVISVAVVLVLRKRRIVKVEEEHYEMPNCSPNVNNNDDENVRNSNIYEVIPDSGNCSEHESTSVDCSAKENDYLTPVMESEEAPYLWIP